MADKPRASKLDQQIEQNLRRVYSEATSQEVPDRFTKLLEQLREQEQKSGQSEGGNKS